MDLTEAQRHVLDLIASYPNVWPLRAEIERRLIPQPVHTIDELIAIGLVETWKRPDGAVVVLTLRAVHEIGIVADERWEYRSDLVRSDLLFRRGTGSLADRKVPCQVATETPRWTPGVRDVAGVKPRTRRVRLGEVAAEREKPVTPPGYAIEAPPAFLSFKPPPKRGTKQFRGEDGETTTDPTKATRLFAGPDGTGGVPIVVDARKQRQRPVEAARRALARAGAGRKRA